MNLVGRGSQPRWIWIVLVWCGVGVFDGTQTVFSMRADGMHHNWVSLFFFSWFVWLPWALVTSLAFNLARRRASRPRSPVSLILSHLATFSGLVLASTAWHAWLDRVMDPWRITGPPPPFLSLWFSKFYGGILSSLILYSFVVTVGYVLDSRERLAFQQTETARLNEQLSKAQLNALRNQIEPHFLFNTLHAIAGLVREKRNDDAVSMIAGLSDFLRHVVADSGRQEVPLSEEMEFVQRYLDIQKVRFADRLQLNVDVPTELSSAQVPSLVLQPMVENAVKHGIAKRAQGGAIRISASRSNGMLTLGVYNDGPPLPADWEHTSTGIGISNVRTRLQGLYGGRCRLTMRNQEPDGVEVLMSLPFTEK